MSDISDGDPARASIGRLANILEHRTHHGELKADEAGVLRVWLKQHQKMASTFPDQVICDEVKNILSEGILGEEKRVYFVQRLRGLLAARKRDLTGRGLVNELTYDSVNAIVFPYMRFCLTGDFIHGDRHKCVAEIRHRRGLISASVSRRVNYLIVGSLGSIEWRRENLGAKIERAIYYKQQGDPILIVRESVWRNALEAA